MKNEFLIKRDKAILMNYGKSYQYTPRQREKRLRRREKSILKPVAASEEGEISDQEKGLDWSSLQNDQSRTRHDSGAAFNEIDCFIQRRAAERAGERQVARRFVVD